MQELVGSVRRSFVFRSSTSGDDAGGGLGGFVEKIGASIRRSRIGLFAKPPAPPALPSVKKRDAPPIRWRKGELIGCGAFGRVYMGMNLDSGELLAVKQVSNYQLREIFCFSFLFLMFNFHYIFVDEGFDSGKCFKGENTGIKGNLLEVHLKVCLTLYT